MGNVPNDFEEEAIKGQGWPALHWERPGSSKYCIRATPTLQDAPTAERGFAPGGELEPTGPGKPTYKETPAMGVPASNRLAAYGGGDVSIFARTIRQPVPGVSSPSPNA